MMQVGLKAYLLWEADGRPEGGDFSPKARDELRAELRAGKSLQEVEQAMRAVTSIFLDRRLGQWHTNRCQFGRCWRG